MASRTQPPTGPKDTSSILGVAALSTDPIFLIDASGIVLETSGPLSGHPLTGKPLSKCVPADHHETLRTALAQAIGDQESVTLEIPVTGKTGALSWYQARFSPIPGHPTTTTALVTTINVTARRAEEERLRRSERLMVDTAGTAHLGTWEWDIREPTAKWSDELYRIYGLDPSTHTPSYEDYLQRIHPDDRERVKEATEHVFNDHQSYSHDERIYTDNGELRYLHTWAQAVLDSEGNLERLVGVCQDITERKRAEEEVAARLLEKEILLREIHHRVKNNLQMIASLLNLQSRRVDDPKARNAFRDSRTRVRTMALVHEALYRSEDLSRIDFGEYLTNLCRDIEKAVAAGPHVRLNVETHPAQLPIDTAIQSGLIVHELLSNALKHAYPKGGPGTVRVRFGPAKTPPGNYVLSIQDDGIGMAEDFDPRAQSTLGFQIIDSFIDQMNADMKIETAPGKGTTFHIRIP